MAAARVRCTHCGEPFDRRAVNQSYCFEAECRAVRNRDKVRSYRQTRATLDEARLQAWIRRARAA